MSKSFNAWSLRVKDKLRSIEGSKNVFKKMFNGSIFVRNDIVSDENEPCDSKDVSCCENVSNRSIAIDAMGGDLGCSEVVFGVKLAIDKNREFSSSFSHMILVGDQEKLNPLLKSCGLSDNPLVSVFHASECIGMKDHPLKAIKSKRDSSMIRAIELVKEGKAQVVLSCGNTGSLMAGSTIKLRPMNGIERPVLATIAPANDHNFVILDVGANPSSNSKQLVHNAILGYNYAKIALKKSNPRVGLLTIGTEEWKGNELITETHQKLKKIKSFINYSGLIEGFQVFDNHVDVVVCDGFVGNIVLKTCEGLFLQFKDFLKKELKSTCIRKIGGLLAKGAFVKMKNHFDPERFGGAPLLGLNGMVVKSHGGSTRNAIMNAIFMANRFVQDNFYQNLTIELEKVNKLIDEN